jgi:hypothetical protein
MATASQALPPPGQGGSPGGGSPSPAPASNTGGAERTISLVRQIVSAARMLGQIVPGAVPEIRQINDLAQQVQMKIIQSQPSQEPQAPPV